MTTRQLEDHERRFSGILLDEVNPSQGLSRAFKSRRPPSRRGKTQHIPGYFKVLLGSAPPPEPCSPPAG